MNDTLNPENKKSAALDRSWQNAITSGRTDRGNLQVNLDFLEQTGLMSKGKKALELGCGTGNLAAYLQSQGIAMTASDISKTAIEHARKIHPDVELRTHTAEELPYGNESFDIVMSFDVLEHVPNTARHLREVHRVLRNNGYYLFQTPNKLSNAAFETLKCRSMEWKKYHPSLHFYGQLKRRLKRSGFDPKFVKMNTMNEFTINKIKRLGLPAWLFSWINFRFMPFCLQTNFYVIAKKAAL